MNNIPKIIYEDNHLIVAVKQPGVLSQADGSDAPDMLTLLKAYIKEKYNKPGEVFLGLLHRLDRPVGGVMVFAKTSKAASRISEQIRKHEMVKKYRAIVWGKLPKSEDRLENYIYKNSKTNMVVVYDDSRKAPKDAKLSALNFTTIKYGKFQGRDITLVEIELETGRSHQIRSQFAHIGYPLVGDMKYGKSGVKCDICLKSFLIGFVHPTTKEYMEFTLDNDSFDTPPWLDILF